MSDIITCIRCGDEIDTSNKANKAIRMCKGCRINNGYSTHQGWNGCGNYAIPPGSSSCACCHPVPSAPPTLPSGAMGSARLVPPAHTAPDLSDWKVWRDHGRNPNHCACDIPRSQCNFHKDT